MTNPRPSTESTNEMASAHHVSASTVQCVGIVGGGLAGLACAIAAAVRGASVDLYDELVAPAPVAAFVEVVPNMLRDLAALGLADDCVRAGFAFRGQEVIDRQGHLRLEIAMPHLAGQRYPAALGIEHDELTRILERHARARGVRLHRGVAVRDVVYRDDRAELALANGAVQSFDLVVLASGTQSALRAALFAHAVEAHQVDQVWWYTLVQRPLDLQRSTLYVGSAGRKVLMVPIRGDLAGLALVEPLRDASDACAMSPVEHVRTALARFPSRLSSVTQQVRDDAPVTRRTLHSSLMPSPWHQRVVVAVGNAAHAMPPHFGQAAAQALEDAVVISDLLRSARSGAELAERYTERRFDRARQVHEIAWTAARWDLEPSTTTNLRELSETLSRIVATPA